MTDFDIGSGGGLAIFTNNDDSPGDMLSPGNFDFQIESGPIQGMTEVGVPTNVAGGITLDVDNSAPAVFETGGSTSLQDLNVPTPVQPPTDTFINKPPPREKVTSFSSDATIEAEPMSGRGVFNKPRKPKNKTRISKGSIPESPPAPEPIVMNQIDSPKPLQVEELPASPPLPQEINMGFDDLLDSSKLKPIKEDKEPAAYPMPEPITSPVDSYGGVSPEPIKPSFDYPSAPEPAPRYDPPPQPADYQPTYYAEPEIPKYANEDEEKLDLLLKLKALETRKGITLSKHYNSKSSVEELRLEYKNQTKIIESEASVKFMRNGLIFATSGLEYLNRRFDPVGAKLDGWGESVMENIMDYDGIFERLHDKYSGSVEMEPEMELLFALGGSAFMFHLSKTLFKTAVPQFDNVLRERPGLVQEIFGAATEAARRQQATEHAQAQFAQTGPMPSNAAGPMGGGGPMGGSMQPPPINLGSILGSILPGGMPGGAPGAGGLASDPLPRPINTQDIPDPPMNNLYRDMIRQEDALSVSSDTSQKIGQATIIRSPDKGGVIRI